MSEGASDPPDQQGYAVAELLEVPRIGECVYSGDVSDRKLIRVGQEPLVVDCKSCSRGGCNYAFRSEDGRLVQNDCPGFSTVRPTSGLIDDLDYCLRNGYPDHTKTAIRELFASGFFTVKRSNDTLRNI